MMDVRFDDKPLPYTLNEERLYEDVAIKMETSNIKDGCASTEYCKGIFCPGNQVCVDTWRYGECQCPKGQRFNGSKCENANDCELCLPAGTKYCEKYDDTNHMRVFSYDELNLNLNLENSYLYSEEYPPKYWFFNELKPRPVATNYDQNKQYSYYGHYDDKENLDQSDLLNEYKCVCRSGYYGIYCNAQASVIRPVAFLSFEALIAILSCLATLLGMLLLMPNVYLGITCVNVNQTPVFVCFISYHTHVRGVYTQTAATVKALYAWRRSKRRSP
jgi:hypothetical protein